MPTADDNPAKRLTVGAAAVATVLTIAAPSAQAANVACSRDSSISGCHANCSRFTNDGEHATIYNDTTQYIRFRVYYKNRNGIHTVLDKTLASGDSAMYNLTIPDGYQVGVDVQNDTLGRVALNTLIA